MVVRAWYRPVPLGFCPRFLIEDRHAWVVGKVAPGNERPQVAQMEFAFRGYFVVDEDGKEKVRSSCDSRPYPIFHLLELKDERLTAAGEPEPKVTRGPGVVVPPADPVPKEVVEEKVEPKPAKARKTKRRLKRKKRRQRRRRRKPRQ